LPLAVRYLGAERYGVWATITTTAVWINLLDLGIANTLTNHISRAYARDDESYAARYFTNALLLTVGIAVVAGVTAAWAFPRVDWAAIFNVSASVPAREIEQTAAIAVGLMLLALPSNLASKVLAGYQQLHRYNYANCAGAFASLAGLAIGVMLHVSMPLLFLMSVGCLTFTSFFNLLLVIGWQKRWLLPRPSLIEVGPARELLSSGSSFFLIQAAAVVVFSSDNLIVGHYLGASEVTPYSVTWRVVGFAAVLQSLIFPALWPAYAEAYSKGDYGWIKQTFAVTMKGTLALNAASALVLMLAGRTLIRMWAGPAAVPGIYLLLAMGAWSIVNGFMSAESCLLAALNRTRQQAVLSIVAAALNVGLSIWLVRHIGSLGVVSGTILSYLIVLVIPQTLIVCKIWRSELGGEKSLFAFRSSPLARASID
jgi:O-antigen/teichoic acid export membrane protein